MKKLIQRVRDWMIKKLGGYTREEYDATVRPALNLGPDVRTKKMERLRAQVEIEPSEIQVYQNSDLFIQILAQRMMPLIKDRMQIRRLVDSPEYSPAGNIVIEGYITVVKED